MLVQGWRQRLYVKVGIDRIEVRDPRSGAARVVEARPGFSTARLLVGTFAPFEQSLKQAVKAVAPGGWLRLAPQLILQPLARHEGGLSEIEQRILLEGAHGAGAAQAWIHQGAELTDAQVLGCAPPR